MRRLIKRGLGLVGILMVGWHIAAAPAHAQEVNPEALEQSRRILELTNTQALGEQMLTMIMPQILNLVAAANPSKEAEVRQLMAEYFEPSLRAAIPELMDDCAKVYARHFTADELIELTAFYQTPLGQNLITKMPQVMVDLNAVGQQWGFTAAQRALEMLAPILRERGLQVPA